MLKLVLDTNIFISAINFDAKPELIVRLVSSKQAKGYISRFIIAEVCTTLRNKFKFSPEKIDRAENILLNNFVLIEPGIIINTIKNCSPDNKILACAVAAKADYLISGDKKHILLLKKIKNIPILSPEQFLKLLYHTART